MRIHSRFVVWSLLLLSFAILVGGDFWHDIFRTDHYKAPHFATPEFVDAQLGLEGVNGSIVCFGDYNSDTFTDVFVLSPDRTHVTPYLWDGASFKFVPAPVAVTTTGIISVGAADFNYDGKLDLLVQVENTTSLPLINMYIYSNPSTAPIASPAWSALSPVLVIEADGDLRPDLFGTDASSNSRGVWLNQESGWLFEPQINANTLPPLVSPQLSAFADVNGDCRADLLVTSCADGSPVAACTKPQLEVWLSGQPSPATPKNTLSLFTELTRKWALMPGVRQISVADFDSDGAPDLLFVVCPTPGCGNAYVSIAYGKLKPLCDTFSLSSEFCRSLSALCSADDTWDFPGLATLIPSKDYVTVTSNVTQASTQLSGDMTVRVGDYDMDGYPDLAVPMATGLQLWHSRPCDSTVCASGASAASRRTFSLDLSSTAVRNLDDVESAAFIDLGEKGSLDLLVVTQPPNGASRPVSLYNNLNLDAFFLKTLGLNGICAAWCPTGKRFPEKPYGGVQVGGTFVFSTTRANGKRHLVQATALSQVGIVSMQTPYAFFGLGRTNNYVEMLYYGMPLREKHNHHYWTPIMPNAQVYVVPYPTDQPPLWSIDSFISPADYVGWVFVAFAVALLANALIVVFFRSRELREDENEKKASAHLFSFDIL